ncbi:MAG: hypothetical protein AVDCRST_MAG50-2708, partial [uncultured Acidimicrobiales bacterium]
DRDRRAGRAGRARACGHPRLHPRPPVGRQVHPDRADPRRDHRRRGGDVLRRGPARLAARAAAPRHDGGEVRHRRRLVHAPAVRLEPVHPGLRVGAPPRHRRVHRLPHDVRVLL